MFIKHDDLRGSRSSWQFPHLHNTHATAKGEPRGVYVEPRWPVTLALLQATQEKQGLEIFALAIESAHRENLKSDQGRIGHPGMSIQFELRGTGKSSRRSQVGTRKNRGFERSDIRKTGVLLLSMITKAACFPGFQGVNAYEIESDGADRLCLA